MADKIRLGFVGANINSGWSTQSHYPALLASPDVELTAVCTSRPESAEEARKAFGAKLAFHDFREMVVSPEIDAVAVVVRVPLHYEPTKAAIEAGKADIVIGTHKLLQGDIKFKNLGLAVVDEEQRFGVSHKERLKQLRQQVDVLTLSATPIPRTLNMALAGIRDLSTMDSAPEARLPVKTFVSEYSEYGEKAAMRQ